MAGHARPCRPPLLPDHGRGLTGEDLRKISLAPVYATVRGREHDAQEFIDRLGAVMREQRPRTGRWSSVEDDEFALYAERYLEAVASRAPDPVQQMRDRFLREGRNVSLAKVRDRLKGCRKFMWLVGSRQGQAGAEAGPSLLNWRKSKGDKSDA